MTSFRTRSLWSGGRANDIVNVLAFSPDGKYLVMAGAEIPGRGGMASKGTVTVWTVATEKVLFEAKSLGFNSFAAVFSPASDKLATGGETGTSVWDLATHKESPRLENESRAVQAVTFSRDGKDVFTGDIHGVVRRWNLQTGKCVEIDSGGRAIALTPCYSCPMGRPSSPALPAVTAVRHDAGIRPNRARKNTASRPVLRYTDWRSVPTGARWWQRRSAGFGVGISLIAVNFPR